MLDFVLGALGALLCAACFISGVFAERYLRGGIYRKAPVQEDEDEVKKAEEARAKRKFLIEQQEAFHEMQSYSAETAYGMKDGDGETI